MNRKPFWNYVYFTALLNIAILMHFPSITYSQTTTIITNSQPECISVDPTFGCFRASGDIDVTITGENTSFDETTVVTFSCAYITVNSQTVSSPTEIIANITIEQVALIQRCDVTVTTGSTSITCNNVFEIVDCFPHIPVVSPSEAEASETIDVTITSYDIDMTGKSITKDNVNFACDGVTVNSATVNSATEIVANITVACKAPACTGDVMIVGSGGVGIVSPQAFTVNEKPPCTMNFEPTSVRTGFFMPRIAQLTITGGGEVCCEFDDTTSVTIDGNVKVLGTEIIPPNELKVKALLPPVILGGKGVKTVTVQTGDTETTATLTVQGLIF
jgi:hypothetical protein